jgi:Fe-S-cluster containining protein
MEFYRARKFLLRRDKRGLWIVFLHECPHLTASGCDIYETRPMLCRTAKPDGFTCKLCLEIAEAIGLKSQDNDEVKP